MTGWGVALQKKGKSSKSVDFIRLLMKVVELLKYSQNVQTEL